MSRYVQAAATVPEPCHVFGTVLKPFCLGHHLLFRRLNLPFAGLPKAEASDEDLFVGIAVCGQSYEETLSQMLSGEWANVFSRWKKQLAGNRWRGIRPLNKQQRDDGFILFRAYLSDGYQKTPVWRYESGGSLSLSAPWELLLKNKLVMSGYSETEALNGYLPARWHDYYTIGELNAAANCLDPAKFRRVFYTEDDFQNLHPAETTETE